MSLNYWQSPTMPTMERLYLDRTVLLKLGDLDPAEVKIWIEPSESLRSGWAIKSKGEVSSVGRGVLFRQRVMEALDIDETTPWLILKTLANKPRKSAAKKGKGKDAWKTRDAGTSPELRPKEALALDIESIKMVGPVTIQVDHREPESLVKMLERHPMVTVERVTLDLGDISVEDREGNRLLIERKRCDDSGKTDFEISIQDDGRLFDQSERLKLAAGASETQVIPIVLLEGDVYGNSRTMLMQQVTGALTFLAAVQRVSVLTAYNQTHAAYVIAKLASHFLDGLFTPVSLHRAKPKAVFGQQKYVLESLPGVSSKTAELLLETFGSVRKVMSASYEELLAVHGLGKKKVDALIKVLGED